MTNEIKEIKHILELLHFECNPKAREEDIEKILDYITNLQETVNQYENPDDLTLFYMWLDEKAKDKMKQLQEENERLHIELEDKAYEQLKEQCFNYKSRIDKAIEYINEKADYPISYYHCLKELRNILQGEDKE